MWRESKQDLSLHVSLNAQILIMIWIWLYGIKSYTYSMMNEYLAICYNASLQIIVPHCKDWSIFCFDVADDLVPCKTVTARYIPEKLVAFKLEMPAVDHSIKVRLVFQRSRSKNRQQVARQTGLRAVQIETNGLASVGFC